MKYWISATISGGTALSDPIEADSVKDALDIAVEHPDLEPSFCHVCGRGCEDPQVVHVFATNTKDDGDSGDRRID